MSEETTASAPTEPVAEPAPAPEPIISEPITEVQTPTAQPVEPLNPEPVSAPEATPTPESQLEPTDTPETNPASNGTSPQPVVIPPPVITKPYSRSLLAKARDIIQFHKRKKLDKIMSLFLKKATISNDEVEKLLHISDATATRYLKQLEKEGKVRRQGVPGHASYSRM